MKNLLKTILFFIVAIFFSACNSPTGGDDGDDTTTTGGDSEVTTTTTGGDSEVTTTTTGSDEESYSLVATWTMTSMTDGDQTIEASDDFQFILTINANGTYSQTIIAYDDSESNSGTWGLAEGILILDNNVNLEYSFINEDTLSLSEVGTNMTVIFTRQ